MPEPGPRDLDYVRLNTEINRGIDRAERERRTLLAAARVGNLYALLALKKKWGLRLPAVEKRYNLDFSKLRKSA